jgi:enoyl-CoA hydratase/carnithine racemase
MERRDGILQVQLQTDGGPGGGSGWFEVWSQVWWEIGNDPENEVIIVTGTGDRWIQRPTEMEDGMPSHTPESIFETYYGALKNTENVLFGINVPTIGAINGPAAVHFESALLCDITLCTEGTYFRDPHAAWGLAPGDGLGMMFQELMGAKRAAYYLYTSEPIDAQTALEYGMVNEVLPDDRLLPRAWEIAERIRAMPRLARLMAKQIVRRRYQQRHVSDAAFHAAHELLALVLDTSAGNALTAEQKRSAEDRWQAITGRSYHGS